MGIRVGVQDCQSAPFVTSPANHTSLLLISRRLQHISAANETPEVHDITLPPGQ